MALIGDITLGQYYPGRSFLHALDPRSKFLASLILMACLLFAHGIGSMTLHLALCVLIWSLSGIPARVILTSLRPFLWIVAIVALVQLFTSGGSVLFTLPVVGWVVRDGGVVNAFVYSIRLVLLVTLSTTLTMTTQPVDLTDGLEKLLSPMKRLRVPVHEIALMVTLALRFIPILIREAERVRNAQLSRGVSLEGSLLRRLEAVVPMILPLFLTAMQKAEDLALAMEARAFSGTELRTSYNELAVAGRDYLVLVASTAIFAMTLGLG